MSVIIIINLVFMYFIISEISETIHPNVKTSKHQHITLISLNRPDDKNSLNVETLYDLKKAVTNFENDSSSTVAVLYGEGGSFCAGMDSDELSNAPQIFNVINKSLVYLIFIIKQLFILS